MKTFFRYHEIPFLFLLIIMTISVCGDYDYIGYDSYKNFDAKNSIGFYVGQGATDNYIKTISGASSVPLFHDFNNDSIMEVVVLSGTTLKLYSGTTLTLKSTIVLNCTYKRFSNPILYDIKGDGIKDYIIGCGTDSIIDVINISNSLQFKRIKSLAIPTAYQIMLGCGGSNDGKPMCSAVYVNKLASTYTTSTAMYILNFNSTSFSASPTVLNDGSAISSTMALPYIKSMSCTEIDSLEGSECVFNFVHINQYNINKYRFEMWNIYNMSYNPTRKKQYNITTSATVINGWDKSLSSIQLMNVGSADGLYFGVGYQINSQEFKLSILDNDFKVFSQFPRGLLNLNADADGQIVSNPFLAKTLGSGIVSNDICMFGFLRQGHGLTPAYTLNLVCGSLDSGMNKDGIEFAMDVSLEDYNMTEGNYSFIAHVSQQEPNITYHNGIGINKDEILTSYGVLSVDTDNLFRSDLGAQDVYLLHKIYDNPYELPSVVMSEDLSGDNYPELVIYNNANLISIDTKKTNHQAYIGNPKELNPCTDRGQWKQNTTVSLKFTGNDIDNDQVCSRVVVYKGLSFEFNTSWVCGANGTTFEHQFIANRTITSGILQAQLYDNSQMTPIINTFNYSFSVGLSGTIFGDCSKTETGSGITTPSNYTYTESPKETNAGKDIMQSFDNNTGLGSNVNWLLITLIVAISGTFIIAKYSQYNDARILGSIFFAILGIMFLMGAVMGFISAGIVISVIVLLLVVFIVGIWRALSQNSGGAL